ncbi:MAG: hypothetical protein J2P54_05950 [Bradyrhizobiaceae bacterium]|nr:hypothetical protein [Bradyrhizobiaceae bacterium]
MPPDDVSLVRQLRIFALAEAGVQTPDVAVSRITSSHIRSLIAVSENTSLAAAGRYCRSHNPPCTAQQEASKVSCAGGCSSINDAAARNE